MVIEVEQREIPLLDGYVGNLTPEQEAKLQELWTKFLDTCANAEDDADVSKKAGGAGLAGWDESKSGPDGAGIPKDDKAKDELKAREEQAALDDLLNNYGPSALRNTFWKFVKADNPDTDMLRFLRARKWDVGRAFAMMAGCMKWRLDNAVEELAEAGDLGNASIEKFLDQQRSGKTYALGTTDNEQPICYIHVKKHLTWGQPGASMSKYVIYAMESFRLLMMPPNDKVVLLFDLTGFGLKNMDWNCILFIVKCLEAYYPESLGTLFIHNAPWIFHGIWKLLGPMLDPVVRSKVRFTKKPEDIDLVPRERLAAIMGGDNVQEFEFVEPVEGENDKLKDQEGRKRTWGKYMALAKQYEDVTRKWVASKGADKDVLGQRDLLVKKLRLAQFELEPYHRGLTVYHRNGTIDGQGIVTWNYKLADGTEYRHVVGKKYCADALRKQIAEIEGGASPEQAEAVAESAGEAQAGGVGAAAGAGAAAAAAAAAAAVASGGDGGADEFHEAPIASHEATNKAVDADTPKVAAEDAKAAAATGNGQATTNGTSEISEKLEQTSLTTTDLDTTNGAEVKKTSTIKQKTFGFGSKLKSVVSAGKA